MPDERHEPLPQVLTRRLLIPFQTGDLDQPTRIHLDQTISFSTPYGDGRMNGRVEVLDRGIDSVGSEEFWIWVWEGLEHVSRGGDEERDGGEVGVECGEEDGTVGEDRREGLGDGDDLEDDGWGVHNQDHQLGPYIPPNPTTLTLTPPPRNIQNTPTNPLCDMFNHLPSLFPILFGRGDFQGGRILTRVDCSDT